MATSGSVTVRMRSAASGRMENAVEKWKARNPAGLPTFPPRRRRRRAHVFNPRRLTPPENQKPDRSPVNKNGQIDLLTTVPPWRQSKALALTESRVLLFV